MPAGPAAYAGQPVPKLSVAVSLLPVLAAFVVLFVKGWYPDNYFSAYGPDVVFFGGLKMDTVGAFLGVWSFVFLTNLLAYWSQTEMFAWGTNFLQDPKAPRDALTSSDLQIQVWRQVYVLYVRLGSVINTFVGISNFYLVIARTCAALIGEYWTTRGFLRDKCRAERVDRDRRFARW